MENLDQIANQIRQMKNTFKAFAEAEELVNVILNSSAILAEHEKKKADILAEIDVKEKASELSLQNTEDQKRQELEKLESALIQTQDEMDKKIDELDSLISEKTIQLKEVQTSYEERKAEIVEKIEVQEEILVEKREELAELNKSIFEIKEKMKKILS